MANEKKEPTKEEQIQTNLKSTLGSEWIQNTLGSNSVKNNPFLYGQLGVQGANTTYDTTMFSEDATKLRKKMYDEQKANGAQLGVYGDPAMPSNYDVSANVAQQFHEIVSLAKLSDLEAMVKPLAKGFEFKLPDKLKNFSALELMTKLQKGEELSEDEHNALASQQLLTQAYTRAVALKASQSNYFSDLNKNAEKIAEAYKTEEKDKGKK